MELLITIEQDSAAFEDAGIATETARLLRELADRIEQEGPPECWLLYDANGNSVGAASQR